MSTLRFFNPETGKELGVGKGIVKTDLSLKEEGPVAFSRPKPFELTGTVTVTRKPGQMRKIRSLLKKQRVPRKMKKAARNVSVDVRHMEHDIIADPAEKDVILRLDVDTAIMVRGRRTRMTERVINILRAMFARQQKRAIDEMMAPLYL